jgi:hypothetical protein
MPVWVKGRIVLAFSGRPHFDLEAASQNTEAFVGEPKNFA